MSNGIGRNPLNDISKVYLEQIVEGKKDSSYLETDMKKRQANNEKARKEMEKVPGQKNPHFEQQGWDTVNSLADAFKAMQEGVRDVEPEKGTAERKARLEKKRGMKMDDHPQYAKEALDPVGKEDADIDNDGDTDKSDKYLHKRRKAISAAMKKRLKESRQLTEIISDDNDQKEIKEKKVKNTVKVNPKLGEAVEEIGGTIIEMVEVDEFSGVQSEVFQELLDEGYPIEDVQNALEEAKITYGHDTDGKSEGMRDRLKKKAKGFLGKVAHKAFHAARDAKRAAEPTVQRAKTSAKRGLRKAALKVADKLKEETVDEAVYGGTNKPAPTDTRLTVTNADKKANTPAYQKFKAGDKRYKAADHMTEGDGDPCWDTHKQVGMKKKGGKMVPNCVPKEEVEVSEEGSMSQQEIRLQKRKAMIDQLIAKKRKQSLDKEKGSSETPAKAMGEDADLEKMQKDADANRARAAKLKDRNVTRGSASLAAAKVADDVKKAARTGPQQHKGTRTGVMRVEGLSIDQQMRISKEYNRKSPEEKKAANAKVLGTIKKVKREKDTRTDAQKMTDATGPRPGSRYRGD